VHFVPEYIFDTVDACVDGNRELVVDELVDFVSVWVARVLLLLVYGHLFTIFVREEETLLLLVVHVEITIDVGFDSSQRTFDLVWQSCRMGGDQYGGVECKL